MVVIPVLGECSILSESFITKQIQDTTPYAFYSFITIRFHAAGLCQLQSSDKYTKSLTSKNSLTSKSCI